MNGQATTYKVAIADQQTRLKLDFAGIREIAGTVLAGEGIKAARISVAYLTDAAIHELNRRFLQHDEPTDVITFPMSGPGAKVLEAEIAISTDTAARVAEEKQHPAANEAALYLIHALLHLCGFDDRDARQREQMRRQEGKYLAKLKIHLADYPVGVRGFQEGEARSSKKRYQRRPGRMVRRKSASPRKGG